MSKPNPIGITATLAHLTDHYQIQALKHAFRLLDEPKTKPCAECGAATPPKDLHMRADALEVCDKCYIPEEEEEDEDPNIRPVRDEGGTVIYWE